MTRQSGKVDIRAVALEPITHNAGTSGNTQLLRVQEIVTGDGKLARVPFISGNSVKHRLRAAAVRYALDVLEVPDGSLSKAEVDLIFSGGHLSKGGSAVDLQTARRLEELFPALSLCGYSAGNCMTESKIRVSHLHVVCEENAWRLPDDLRKHPAVKLRAGALRGEEFGTRRDAALSGDSVRLLTAGEQEKVVVKKTKKLKGEGDEKKDRDSLQMIYDFQVIRPGATFFGSVVYEDATEMERAALASAFHRASTGSRGDGLTMSVGGKSSVGFGSIAVELRGSVRASAAQYEPSTGVVAHADGPNREYVEHLRSRRDDILATIREAVR